jgi:hypothetical protein
VSSATLSSISSGFLGVFSVMVAGPCGDVIVGVALSSGLSGLEVSVAPALSRRGFLCLCGMLSDLRIR